MMLVTRDNEMRAEGREEGRIEGRVEGTVDTLREMGIDEDVIIAKIKEKYALTEDEAEAYVAI